MRGSGRTHSMLVAALQAAARGDTVLLIAANANHVKELDDRLCRMASDEYPTRSVELVEMVRVIAHPNLCGLPRGQKYDRVYEDHFSVEMRQAPFRRANWGLRCMVCQDCLAEICTCGSVRRCDSPGAAAWLASPEARGGARDPYIIHLADCVLNNTANNYEMARACYAEQMRTGRFFTAQGIYQRPEGTEFLREPNSDLLEAGMRDRR